MESYQEFVSQSTVALVIHGIMMMYDENLWTSMIIAWYSYFEMLANTL